MCNSRLDRKKRANQMRSKFVVGSLVGISLVACVGATNIAQQRNVSDVVESVVCDSGISCEVRKNAVEEEQAKEPLNPANDDSPATVVSRCPEGMVFVEGDYCPAAVENCLYFVGIDGQRVPETKKWPGRCGEYQYPTKCISKHKIHKAFCIDKFEYPNIEGHVPQSWMSWYDAKKTAESIGKRLCTRSEWTFSCEGPDMKPYPYGDGYHRDKTACNFDQHIDNFNVFSCTPYRNSEGHMVAPATDAPCKKHLDNLLVSSGSMPRCYSPFGVFDQVGNIDEFVVNETGHPYKSGLVGGHVFGVRNACRPMTEAHNEGFFWYETGTRFCKDAQ